MTFDEWWSTYKQDFVSKYIEMSLYDIAHSAYEFGLQTMLERQKKSE